MDQVLGKVKLRAMQREYLAGAHRLLSDCEDCSLKDKSVVVCTTLTRAAAQPLVLLVGDDLEVGPVHKPLAPARSKASEMVRKAE
jgi:DTW domain-containing protein YfiP